MIATVWYPPDRWQVREIVVTRTLPWDVGPDFGVGLGVTRGNNWGDIGQRLTVRVESSDLVVRLFDGNTWARLLHVEDGEPLEEYRAFAPPPSVPRLDVDFGGRIRLLGYDLDCIERQAECSVRLWWQAQTRLDTSYSVFAQLLGPRGGVRAQADSVPQAGGYPTVWWLPDEVVADRLTLEIPEDLPPDLQYRLITGLYDPATGVRLPVSRTGADFVELTTITP
jgi:hypothetical protein